MQMMYNITENSKKQLAAPIASFFVQYLQTNGVLSPRREIP